MSLNIYPLRNCTNYAVFKDGRHVDAIAKFGSEWRLMYNKESFTADERAEINAKVAELNGHADEVKP